MPNVTPGAQTTENETRKSSSTWSIVATVLGLIVTIGSSVAAGLGADTTVGDRNPVASLGLMGVEEYRFDDWVSTAWILAAASFSAPEYEED